MELTKILAVQNRVPISGGSTIITVPTGAAGIAVGSVACSLRKTNDTTFWTDADIDANLDRVIVRLDGKPIIDMIGLEWMDIMGYEHALGANAGIVPIRFGQVDGRQPQDEDEPMLGTLDVGSVEVELKWTGAIPATSQVDAVMTGRQNEPLGSYYAWRRQSPSVNGTNRVVTDLGRLAASDFLSAVHVFKSTVTRTEVAVANEIITEGVGAFQAHLNRENFRNPNAGWIHLDIGRSRRNADAVPSLGGNIRLTNDYSVDPAGAVTIVLKVAERYQKS